MHTPSNIVQRGARSILLNGLALVFVGLLWGLVVPNTPHPRLALGAHLQFVSGGMLLLVLALLLFTLPHTVGRLGMAVMVIAAWLTWPMALSEAANAWWGTKEMLPIAAGQAGATGGAAWQEAIVKATHVIAALALIVAWVPLIAGFARRPSESRLQDGVHTPPAK